jgi:threonine dehydrogenase-like Zn-dependent dehydrogenase
VAVPARNLHTVPDEISDERAVFIEPLAAAIHAMDDAPPKAGDRMLVIGDGKLALLIAFSLASRRADLRQLLVVGKHEDKLRLVKELGIDTALVGSAAPTGFDVVVEATGNPSGLQLALAATRPEGTVVLKSTYAGASSVDLAPIVINELRVVGSRCGDFSRAIDVLGREAIDPSPLIEEIYALDQAEQAFAHAERPGALKVLLRP